MSWDLAAIKADIATVAMTGVSGGPITAGGVALAGASSTNLPAIPQTPWLVVKNPAGHVDPGNFERIDFELPATLYLADMEDPVRNDTLAIPFLFAFIDTFRTHVTLGGTVTLAWIRDFDLDAYYQVGDSTYQAIDLTWAVTIAGQGSAYTVG